MDNRENLVNWFIKGTFFSKAYIKDKECKLYINDKKDVRLAVDKAYIDMTPRTFKSKDKDHKIDINQKSKNKALEELAESIFEYIDNRKYDDFDRWHKNVCEDFKDDFNEYVLKPADRIEATFGKAQKIVNMTFKYLYCFDDAEDYIEFFEKCHMAIDSYIITWYNDNVAKIENVNKIHEAWSNVNYKDYKSIQKNIRKYLEKQTKYDKRPFYTEFIIWQEEKAKAVKKENEKQSKNS